ncbi:MAG: prepilin-type N-terminal cleavage/methylation domain-containing protein [Sedimentibacter sp.]
MSKYGLKKWNNEGFTLVEIIMTIGILGILIVPLMSMFIFSAKINCKSSEEFKAVQMAQMYMEEFKSMHGLNIELYNFNSDSGCYLKNVMETDNAYGAKIKIVPHGIIYYISIDIINGGEIISSLAGSKIYE